MRGFIGLTRTDLQAKGPYAWTYVTIGPVTLNVDHIVAWLPDVCQWGTVTKVLTSTGVVYTVLETYGQVGDIILNTLGGSVVKNP